MIATYSYVRSNYPITLPHTMMTNFKKILKEQNITLVSKALPLGFPSLHIVIVDMVMSDCFIPCPYPLSGVKKLVIKTVKGKYMY